MLDRGFKACGHEASAKKALPDALDSENRREELSNGLASIMPQHPDTKTRADL